jgi:endonuclease V-like protein UPF0215 family
MNKQQTITQISHAIAEGDLAKAEDALDGYVKENIKQAYKDGQDEIIKMVEVHNRKSWFLRISFDTPDTPDEYFNSKYQSIKQ